MTNDDITQKLALLPEGLAEENVKSWTSVIYSFTNLFPLLKDHTAPILKFAINFSGSEQAKLFRAGKAMTELMISTVEENGLMVGDRFIGISSSSSNVQITYEIQGTFNDNKEDIILENMSCDVNTDLISIVQPLLDRLWNETRGKKKA